MRSIPAPHIPPGSSRLKEVLTELVETDQQQSPGRYRELIQQLTANFDDFKEDGTVWGRRSIGTGASIGLGQGSSWPPSQGGQATARTSSKGGGGGAAGVGAAATAINNNDQFIGYTYKRKKVMQN